MAKGLVNPKIEEGYHNLMQYKKGYQQALKDVQEWISEEYGTGKSGSIEYVLRRIDGALKRE